MSASFPAVAPISPTASDIAELYCSLSARLERIVRLGLDASDVVVEDACQFAWDRLLRHRDQVRRDTALWWLARTAVREASKLLRRERRYVSLEAVVAAGTEGGVGRGTNNPEELVLQRERLDLLGQLPERQQQMVWLHALGLSYAEIAIQTESTMRTVERQLLRAKRAMRALDGVSPAPGAPPPAVHTRRSALAA
jgi:RNA polymerase sigma factor (sigma-70 family)